MERDIGRAIRLRTALSRMTDKLTGYFRSPDPATNHSTCDFTPDKRATWHGYDANWTGVLSHLGTSSLPSFVGCGITSSAQFFPCPPVQVLGRESPLWEYTAFRTKLKCTATILSLFCCKAGCRSSRCGEATHMGSHPNRPITI